MLKLMSDLIFKKSCSGTTFFRLDFLNYEKKTTIKQSIGSKKRPRRKRPLLCALGMSELYRVKVPKCGRWRQAHSQRQGLNREVPTEGSPRQTIDLTNRNGLRHMLSGKTA